MQITQVKLNKIFLVTIETFSRHASALPNLKESKNPKIMHAILSRPSNSGTPRQISSNVIVPSDEIQKFYQLSNEDHKKILQENVTKTYKDVNLPFPDNFNKQVGQ